ncbi:AAA family ATPase [Microbispora rosea]|uniref:ATP-binding protein n=1 Tax=Microbispora rosea TaxID=58117 RepID=UPI0037A26CF0
MDSDALFESAIADYLADHFVDRTWLVERIEQHFANPENRYILVTGGPGTGKSTLVAGLTRRHRMSPRYFIRGKDVNTLIGSDAWTMLLTFGYQLMVLDPRLMQSSTLSSVLLTVGRVRPEGSVTLYDIQELFASPFSRIALEGYANITDLGGEFIGFKINRMATESRVIDVGNLEQLALLEPAKRLATLEPNIQLVVLIDAIDELRYRWSRRSAADVLAWLEDCPELPSNMRFLITSRSDDALLEVFRRRHERSLAEISLDVAAEELSELDASDDIRRYLSDVLAEKHIADRLSDPSLAYWVAVRAAGNFLYATLWARAVRQAITQRDDDLLSSLTNISGLPDGLHGIYDYFMILIRELVRRRHGHWSSWASEWQELYFPVLSILAVARDHLSVDNLRDLSGIHGRLDLVLSDLSPFLLRSPSGVRLWHESMAEFLTTFQEGDWPVDPVASHFTMAQRLISRYGDDWSRCDDEYALAHTAIHLVESAAGTTGSVHEQAVGLLLELLGNADFGTVKARRLGIDRILADYIAAEQLFKINHSDQAPSLIDGLAIVVAKYAEWDTQNVPDVLHAILGYRQGADELNVQLLTRLRDTDFLAGFVPDEQMRGTLLIGLAHGLATRMRRTGKSESIGDAYQLLQWAADTVHTLTGNTTVARRLSSIYYDLAYIDYLRGNCVEAAALFQLSIAAAVAAGNSIGAMTTRIVWMRMEVMLDQSRADEFRQLLDSALPVFVEGPHAQRRSMNVHAHQVELAHMIDNLELAIEHLRFIEEDSWLRANHREDLLLGFRARCAILQHEWDVARRHLARLLQEELHETPSGREELSRDLFDYGRALLGTGDPEGARKVWELGLRTPDYAANWYWKPLIQKAIDQLDHLP